MAAPSYGRHEPTVVKCKETDEWHSESNSVQNTYVFFFVV